MPRHELQSSQRMFLGRGAALLLVLALFRSALGQASPPPDLVLTGTVTGAENNTYVEVPFLVPAGVQRVTLTFDYSGKEQHTALDLGVIDTHGLRCWSGGNKRLLTIALASATPSCLPGPVDAGKWKLLIGVPNIRTGETSHYTAKLYFARSGRVADEPLPLRQPLRAGPGWYRGDLHMHTGHSDGSCASQSGAKVPCPVFVTVDAAARRGLDFIAITDHNTTSHYDAMRELAPYFDKVLLIPGREITTFRGHFNLIGTEEFLDFRLGSKSVPEMNTLLRRARQLGGIVSINHPNAPTGEVCMGCGWTPAPSTDLKLVDAVEAVNSGAEDGPYAGTSFWERQLGEGRRLTAIGGSDNHTPQRPLEEIGSVGSPTTVVYAAGLSTPAILEGIRAGHVFVDLTGSSTRLLEFEAESGGTTARMGDSLRASDGTPLVLTVHVKGCAGARVRILLDGAEDPKLLPGAIGSDDEQLGATWTSDGKRHWIRADVVSTEGKLQLLGNPVYINPESQP